MAWAGKACDNRRDLCKNVIRIGQSALVSSKSPIPASTHAQVPKCRLYIFGESP
jgi:hypothetical protein